MGVIYLLVIPEHFLAICLERKIQDIVRELGVIYLRVIQEHFLAISLERKIQGRY